MITLDADLEEVQKLTRTTIASLTKNEFQGLIILTLGGFNARTSDIWEKVEPIFVQYDGADYPLPHPEAIVEMGKIANERKKNENEKHASS